MKNIVKETHFESVEDIQTRVTSVTVINKAKSCGKENNSDIEVPYGTHHDNMIKINVQCLASFRAPYFMVSTSSPVSF